MKPSQVGTVEELHAYLKSVDREWFTIGWRGDPEVYMTDGTTLLERLPDGRVEVTGWSRGTQTSSEVYPDLRSVVQGIVNSHLAREMRLELTRRDLYDSATVTEAPGPGSTSVPPEGQWTVVVSEGEYHLGGMTMGRFRPYDSYEDVGLAADVLQRLVQQSGPTEPATDEDSLVRQGKLTGVGISQRTQQRRDADVPGVGAGDVLDRVGHESGSQLFALGTPFAMRSQPPDMVGAQYHRYRVVDHLPEAREGTAAAWFGQPGGGAMIVAEHPVRWYLDHGHLIEFVDPAGV